MFSNETRMLSRIIATAGRHSLSAQFSFARPTDRPDRTGPCQIFPFEENAGFVFRSRTRTILRESNVVFLIIFQIRNHNPRTQTFLFHFF